jgi:NDP-sugar pyrophosphorylase family protein
MRDGRVVRYDKSNVAGLTHIDWGLGAFRAEAFAGYPDGKLDLVRIYQDLLARDQLFGYEVSERFYEIGSHTGLEELRHLLSKERP